MTASRRLACDAVASVLLRGDFAPAGDAPSGPDSRGLRDPVEARDPAPGDALVLPRTVRRMLVGELITDVNKFLNLFANFSRRRKSNASISSNKREIGWFSGKPP